MKKTLIFDLDGTLIDSLNDIATCMNQVLQDLGLKSYKIKEYNNFVGGGVDFLVNNVLQENTPLLLRQKVTNNFKKLYEETLHTTTKPYKGIYELFDELVKLNYNIAILSNKPHEFTLAYASKLFSKYNLKEIHGQKKAIEKKPNPKAAIQIAKAFNTPCEEVFFIGDTKTDMQTAKNAKMIAIGVLWGFRDKEELLEYGADFLVQTPLEILKIVKD